MPDTSKANAEVVGEPRGRRFGLSRRATIVLAIVAGLLVVGAAGAAWATFDYTNDHAGRLLPGARIAGVDVGGLTSEQAIAAAGAAIRPRLDQPITVSWKDRSWTVTPRELGARNDAEEAVAAAIEASRRTSFFDRMLMALGDDFDFERDIAITYPRQGVRGFIQGIASNLDRDVREAGVDYSSGWVEVLEPREGRAVGLAASRRALHGALIAGQPEIELTVRTVEPASDVKDYDQVLLVRIGENKLYLYEDGEITHEWPVATGLPEYPTPTGEYEVTELRYLPTWVNPAPDTWGADMPAEIPPGPGNPLGVRAINWSAEAIRFHGTSATYSLGYNASHGCVRMSNEDVIELYDMIEVGTPIVSTVVAPLRPLYVSAPDPTVVAEDAGTEKPATDPDEPERKRKREG
jgi:hypothetical protein